MEQLAYNLMFHWFVGRAVAARRRRLVRAVAHSDEVGRGFRAKAATHSN